MIIKKILNNNAVISINNQKKEVILMGKGLAYGKKTGDKIDMHRVTKTFDVGIKESQKKLINMLIDIPIEYMEITDYVINKAKMELKTEINDSLYLSLMDHIHTSIERYREGISLSNHMLLEIKHFYKKEFELGMWTLELIKSKYEIEMDENEAGFIAMHIVSSQVGKNIDDVYEITTFIQQIVELVKEYFDSEFDENSLPYYRFVTHLKHFGLRIFKKAKYPQDKPLENDLLQIVKEKYVQPYLCVIKLTSFIEKKYRYFLEDGEVLFLTIHVARIISDK